MENKEVKSTMLPANFFGDICDVQTKAIDKYDYKYGDKKVTIEYRPYISYRDKQNFIQSVWAVYYTADAEGRFDYRPYVLESIVRLLTVKYYCVNVPLDLEKNDVSVYENFLFCTNFYNELVVHLKDHAILLKALDDYIHVHIMAHQAAAKSNVDILFSRLLDKADKLLDVVKAKLDITEPDDLRSLLDDLASASLPDKSKLE